MLEITSLRLKEKYIQMDHPSGLKLLLCPMTGYSTAYALFAARVGSIDDAFAVGDGEPVKVPAGIAHFLEHKLFESEQGDAFEQYAKTGASANAYTSFDRTAYLFGCTDQFERSLDILIDLVTHPYFTEQTVQKEQGIIGQEIRMMEDDPDWRVMQNLLGAMYREIPLGTDIAGTVESIAEINADTLYRCHKAFYNLNNMVLAVTGNFEISSVVAACDRLLTPAGAQCVRQQERREPNEVHQRRVEQKLEVASPLFEIGFKGQSGSYRENVLAQMVGEVVCDLVAGESTALYRILYDAGLVNGTFSNEVLAGPGYLASIFSGESRDPDAVFEKLCAGIERLQQTGIKSEDFERARRACYGRYVGIYGNVEAMAGMLVLAGLAGFDAYEPLDLLGRLTLNDAQAYLRENLNTARASISIIKG